MSLGCISSVDRRRFFPVSLRSDGKHRKNCVSGESNNRGGAVERETVFELFESQDTWNALVWTSFELTWKMRGEGGVSWCISIHAGDAFEKWNYVLTMIRYE